MLYGIRSPQIGMRPCCCSGDEGLGSEGKRRAVNRMLESEMEITGISHPRRHRDGFERTSSTHLVEGVLDAEAGETIAVFRQLLRSQKVDELDPILMTGSTVLVDDDVVPRLLPKMEQWADREQLVVEFVDEPHAGYHRIRGIGKDWVPRITLG